MSGFEKLLAGHKLAGRYLIRTLIGRGGMGAVFEATDERLGRPVAVKVMAVPAVANEAMDRHRERFRREAQAVAAVRHPNVVPIHDYGTHVELDLDFLVMDLLDGMDAAKLLKEPGGIPVREAVEIATQAAAGLAEGHRKKLVHRDVKPGNLFVSRGEEGVAVHVLDFGIVQVAGGEATQTQLTQAGAAPCTPYYASPEQLHGNAAVRPASDVYSLAVTTLELLRLRPSEKDGATSAAFQALARTAAPDLPEPARGALRAVLHRALEAVPEARYADAGALARALREIHLAHPASPPPHAEPGPRWETPVEPQEEAQQEPQQQLPPTQGTEVAPDGPPFQRGRRRRTSGRRVPMMVLAAATVAVLGASAVSMAALRDAAATRTRERAAKLATAIRRTTAWHKGINDSIDGLEHHSWAAPAGSSGVTRAAALGRGADIRVVSLHEEGGPNPMEEEIYARKGRVFFVHIIHPHSAAPDDRFSYDSTSLIRWRHGDTKTDWPAGASAEAGEKALRVAQWWLRQARAWPVDGRGRSRPRPLAPPADSTAQPPGAGASAGVTPTIRHVPSAPRPDVMR